MRRLTLKAGTAAAKIEKAPELCVGEATKLVLVVVVVPVKLVLIVVDNELVIVIVELSEVTIVVPLPELRDGVPVG